MNDLSYKLSVGMLLSLILIISSIIPIAITRRNQNALYQNQFLCFASSSLFVGACVCVLLVFSHAFPAYSAPVNPTASSSAPQEGESQLRVLNEKHKRQS